MPRSSTSRPQVSTKEALCGVVALEAEAVLHECRVLREVGSIHILKREATAERERRARLRARIVPARLKINPPPKREWCRRASPL